MILPGITCARSQPGPWYAARWPDADVHAARHDPAPALAVAARAEPTAAAPR